LIKLNIAGAPQMASDDLINLKYGQKPRVEAEAGMMSLDPALLSVGDGDEALWAEYLERLDKMSGEGGDDMSGLREIFINIGNFLNIGNFVNDGGNGPSKSQPVANRRPAPAGQGAPKGGAAKSGASAPRGQAAREGQTLSKQRPAPKGQGAPKGGAA
jgi:hypothetical protein